MRRILELDALRGIFAMAIVLAHVGLMPNNLWVFSTVDLFFVLSGYFITANILKNGSKPGFLAIFFSRRALRIWPAYYLALAACLVLHPFLKWDTAPDAWPYYLTFTQNIHDYFGWPGPRFSGMFLHTWTLAIEEQFYLLWPLLLFRAGRRTSYAIVVSFAVMPAMLRFSGFSPFLLLTRCDGLAFGSLVALLVSDPDRVARHRVAFRAVFGAVALAALLVPDFLGREWDSLGTRLFTSRACVTYFGVAGFLLCSQGHPLLAWLRDRRLCHIGQISYGLYLYHPLVFAALPRIYKRFIMRKLGVESTLLMDCVLVAVCFVLAELSKRLVEDPIVALKERLSYQGGSAPSSSIYRGPHPRPEVRRASVVRSSASSQSHEMRDTVEPHGGQK